MHSRCRGIWLAHVISDMFKPIAKQKTYFISVSTEFVHIVYERHREIVKQKDKPLRKALQLVGSLSTVSG